jgi:uncharacterized protein (DUF1697 family)
MLAVAFLRAVNLASHNRVAMADLCSMLTELKLSGARALLASGNLVFEAGTATPQALERKLEQEAQRRLGLQTDFFVRTAKEWSAALAANPFPKEAKQDPARLLVFALKDAPGKAQTRALDEAIRGPEVVLVAGRQAYIVYPDGVGRSRLSLALIERKLGTRATGRNWNTALKLGAMLSAGRQ